MQLHITKKLADKLKIKPELKEVEDELFSWRANYVQENGFRFLIFMNDATRFSIVLNEAKMPKIKKLEPLFKDVLYQTLIEMGMNPDVAEKYLAELGDIAYAKNSDRQRTAQLNKSAEYVWYYLNDLKGDVEISIPINKSYFKYGLDQFGNSQQLFFEMLEKRYGLNIRRFRAFDLTVTLDLAGEDAVRKLRVPANMTFQKFHRALQNAFGWRDYHLYQFSFGAPWNGNPYAPSDVKLVPFEEDLEFSPEAQLIHGKKLEDFLPRYDKMIYTYDFGDDWQHYIQLDKIIEDCGEELPQLIDGSGDAPPEDVGGIPGYYRFLEVMADPQDENHDDIKKWASSQLWQPFDLDERSKCMRF